jgi:hypothetical protein
MNAVEAFMKERRGLCLPETIRITAMLAELSFPLSMTSGHGLLNGPGMDIVAHGLLGRRNPSNSSDKKLRKEHKIVELCQKRRIIIFISRLPARST